MSLFIQEFFKLKSPLELSLVGYTEKLLHDRRLRTVQLNFDIACFFKIMHCTGIFSTFFLSEVHCSILRVQVICALRVLTFVARNVGRIVLIVFIGLQNT